MSGRATAVAVVVALAVAVGSVWAHGESVRLNGGGAVTAGVAGDERSALASSLRPLVEGALASKASGELGKEGE